MEEHSLSALARRLSQLAPTELLASVGALQLMPENVRRATRLELAACGAAAVKSDGTSRPVSRSALDGLVNGPELSDPYLISLEDPIGGWFVESVSFVGGVYRIFPGITTNATFILRHLGTAIALHRDAFSEPNFEARARELFQAVLTLSETIACRAGLARGLLPVEHPGRSRIDIPNAKRLADLRRAVTFSQDEFDSILRRCRTDMATIDALVLDSGSLAADACNPDANPLQASPIVRVDGEYVIANPLGLAAALRHQVICRAVDTSVATELASRHSALLQRTVVNCLELMDIHPAGPSRWRGPQGVLMADGLFSFDADKALYACIVSDDLTDYDRDIVYGLRPHVDLWPVLRAHFETVAEALFSRRNAPNELLILLLPGSLGRSWAVGVGDQGEHAPYEILLLSVSDLETISHIESGKSLLLSKFAHANRKLHDTTDVVAFGLLDKYGVFRDNQYSFYESDDLPPTAMLFDASWEGQLHRESLDRVDRHGALSYDGTHVAEVVLLQDDREIPIYVQPTTFDSRVALLVEGYSNPLWVVSPEFKADDGRNRRHLRLIANMIAYWMWQFTPSLERWFQAALGAHGNVFIISIDADEELDHDATDGDGTSSTASFDVEVLDGYPPGIGVTFHRAALDLLGGGTNDGERIIMSGILSEMSECAASRGQDRLSQAEIATIVEAHAAPPLKKKIIITQRHRDPELDPRGLPRPRTVDPFDEGQLLDELGSYLTTDLGLKVGVIPAAERSVVLNRVAAWYYEQLQRLVHTLNPDGLLRWLVAHNESLLKERASIQLTLATRLACFASHDTIRKEWSTEHSRQAAALLSSRFIIEYVAASPPNGLRPRSNSVYDRLLAIGSEIVNVGFQSDIVRFDLCEATVSILRSGRLGRNFDDSQAALKALMVDYTDAKVVEAEASFSERWQLDGVFESHDGVGEIDEAAREEFGHTLTELRNFWGAAGAVASGISPGACRVQRDTFVQNVADKLQWAKRSVDKLTRNLSLGEREEFLVPPTPYLKTDVYPWRFTRRYSYLRRPFLLVAGTNGPDIVAGPRHLQHSYRYLMHLCCSGRLEALSLPMKKVMSRMASGEAEKFNDKVADALESLGTLKVKRRVKKAGPLRGKLAPPGDIDVLAICRKKRIVFVIECKDLVLARTPREWANELDALVRGGKNRKSTVEKHISRKEWAEVNLRALLAWLDLGYSVKWKVEAVIVLDRRPMAAHFAKCPIPILGLRELLALLKA